MKSWPKVRDALDLNLKYCRREERRVREKYRQLKRKIKVNVKGNKTGERRLTRTLSQIHKVTQERWAKGVERGKKRIAWWREKKGRAEKKEKNTERDRWIQMVARGRGRERTKIKVEVPVYGNLSFSDCELDALSLPPKHANMRR